jgi:hypothetical protein
MPRIAGGVDFSRRTSRFQARPYEPHGRMGTAVRARRAHIAWAQIASGANVRLATVLEECAMGALRVLAASPLRVAHRTQA